MSITLKVSFKRCKELIVCLSMILNHKADSQTFTPVTYLHNIFHQYSGGGYGGGVSFCDFDNDGKDDLTFANKSGAPSLYRNTGTTFVEVFAGIQNNHDVKQINWIDYDNDGDRDLFYCNVKGPFKLYNNDGNMNLTDVSVAAGFPVTDYETYGNSWADYDRDGDLDIYISNYNGIGFGDPTIQNFLYNNNGNGTFTDVTSIAGVGNGVNYSFQAIWLDYNHDLWPDLFVVNDRYNSSNYLYQNNADGTFTDVTISAGLNDYILAMGLTSSDYDHDGDMDIYITNGTDGNLLKRNNGNLTYSNAAGPSGAALNLFCWGDNFVDYDNDTWDDLFVCSTPFMSNNGQNRLLKNTNGVFNNVTSQSGMQSELAWSYSNAVGDLDQDGFPDLVVLNGHPNFSSLWHNNLILNNWMTVDLKGINSNIDGISSWIYCYVGGQKLIKYTHCGESYLGQNSHSEFFGMSTHIQADSIQVLWPSGIVDTWYNIPVNQHLKLIEGEGRKAFVQTQDDLEICAGETLNLDVGQWSEFNWSNGASNNVIAITSSGLYHCVVTDEFGNEFVTDTISILVNPNPLVNHESITPNCFNHSDGSITVIAATENEAEFAEVSWPELGQTGHFLQGLSAGNYGYEVITTTNCISFGNVALEQPTEFISNLETTSVSCFGFNDGSGILQLFGGTLPYSIDWNLFNPDSLTAGEYSITAIDSNGCSITQEFVITQPEELFLDILVTPEVIGNQTGSANINIFGGAMPYSIEWSNGVENLTSLNGLNAGFYSVSIVDAFGCDDSLDFEIELVNSIETIYLEEIKLFPNPAKDMLYINTGNHTSRYEIYDYSGRIVQSGKLTSKTAFIQIDNLSAGSYVILIANSEAIFHTSFIIN